MTDATTTAPLADPSSQARAQAVMRELERLADPVRAAGMARYFQAVPGGYGEGDRFLGVRVPQVRGVCAAHAGLPPAAIDLLLASAWHEVRLAAVLLLGSAYAAGGADERAAIYALYLARTEQINNWDLVDASADRVVGPHLDVVGDAILDQLAASRLVWERRIAVIATFHRLRRGDAASSLHVATLLLADPHPLIHKAVGWMLREVGKRVDEAVLLDFLETHAAAMPATMLSYAVERLTPDQRAHFRALRRAGRAA